MEQEATPLERIKKLDMVDYLASLGYQPAAVRKGYEYWYLSPLRSERTPSFKVNQKRNHWYDFGMAKGGSLIDFGLHYFNVSLRGLIEMFNSDIALPDRVHAVDNL